LFNVAFANVYSYRPFGSIPNHAKVKRFADITQHELVIPLVFSIAPLTAAAADIIPAEAQAAADIGLLKEDGGAATGVRFHMGSSL